MKLTYDPTCDVAYLELQDKPVQVRTIEVTEDLNVDIAPDGSVYGIEFLDANRQLGTDRHGKLVIVNESSGQSTEVALPV